jgi:hypothetical protein
MTSPVKTLEEGATSVKKLLSVVEGKNVLGVNLANL